MSGDVPYLLGGGISQDSGLGQLYTRENLEWSQEVHDLLFHYTTTRGLEGIFRSQNIWATHASFLNDLSELGYARGIIIEVLDGILQETGFELLANLKERGYSDLFVLRDDGVVPFVTSFCEEGDQLSQWRGYGGGGQCYSIGFDLRSIRTAGPGYSYLRKVVYDHDDQVRRLRTLISNWVDVCETALSLPSEHPDHASTFQATWTLQNTLLDYHFAFKHHKFREEKEWRLVKFVVVNNLTTIAREERQRIEDKILESGGGDEYRQDLEVYAHTSHDARELAVVKFRATDKGMLPYIEQAIRGRSGGLAYRLPVRKVIVGPSPYKDNQRDSIDLLVSLRFDLGEISVIPSEVPLR